MVSFNSRTCEGATGLLSLFYLQCLVSIHAPVKVRLGLINLEALIPVSIHAPVKVRQNTDAKILEVYKFQFTHLWRCDPTGDYDIEFVVGFNSRTCEGATGQRLFFI